MKSVSDLLLLPHAVLVRTGHFFDANLIARRGLTLHPCSYSALSLRFPNYEFHSRNDHGCAARIDPVAAKGPCITARPAPESAPPTLPTTPTNKAAHSNSVQISTRIL